MDCHFAMDSLAAVASDAPFDHGLNGRRRVLSSPSLILASNVVEPGVARWLAFQDKIESRPTVTSSGLCGYELAI